MKTDNSTHYHVPEMRRIKHIHFVGIGGAGMGVLQRSYLTKVMLFLALIAKQTG